MSAKSVVTIVSRALAIYFMAWFLSDLTYLPSHLFSVLHYDSGLDVPGRTTYWHDSARISLFFLTFRLVALFFAVQWFYRAGPRIQAYFLTSSGEENGGIDR